jgi:hypothetical protein
VAHCYICDKNMDEVRLDHRDLKPRPCTECETVIAELVQEYDDTDSNFVYVESTLIEYEADLDDARG